MNKMNLILHCGGSAATREAVEKIRTPKGTDRWHPIAHKTLIETVEAELKNLGMRVVNETYGISKEGARMFGLLQITNGHNSPDHTWVAGLRNSHDKTFPAGLCVGSGVFVCDNLAFSSEIVFGRRHTPNIMVDLPKLVVRACGDLAEKWDIQGKRFNTYRETELGNKDAAWILLNAMKQNVFPKTRIDSVWNEWLAPRHPEFKDRTVWSLFNSVTEHLKPKEDASGNSLWDVPARTTRLHALCDSACGIDLTDLNPVPASN